MPVKSRKLCFKVSFFRLKIIIRTHLEDFKCVDATENEKSKNLPSLAFCIHLQNKF